MKYFLLLFLVISVAVSATDITKRLEYADVIKSQDPHAFSDTLDKLEADSASFSSYQTTYFKYLRAFELSYSGKSLDAIEHFKEVFQTTDNRDLKTRALTSLINMYGITRNYVEGYKSVQRLLAIVPDASKEVQDSAYTGLSIFYNQLGEYELGLYSAKQVLKGSDNHRLLCFAGHLKVDSELNLNLIVNPESVNNAIEVCREAKEYAATLFNILVKARLYKNLGEVSIAVALLENSKEIYDNAFYPLAKAGYRAELAHLYLLEEKFDLARQNAEQAIDLSNNAGMLRYRITAFEVLYKFYERIDNYEKAYFYYDKYAVTEKAMLDEIKVAQLAIQQAEFEAQAKSIEIAMLDKENVLLTAQAKLSQSEIENNRLVIATLLLLASVVLIWLLFNRKMQLQLKHRAQTDELTGIANRHHFTQRALSSLAYYQKTQQVLTLVAFDLDFFKRINDSYGHLIGDWALKAVVQAIQQVVRNQDVIGRLGGEEFAILLPGCSINQARSITEKCREAIAAIDTSPTGEKFTITASFGVADTQNCGYKFETLYASADQALYRSKEEGRNRIFVFPESNNMGAEFTEQLI